MWSRIIRFEILFVAAGSLLVVGVAYFFWALSGSGLQRVHFKGRNAPRLCSLI
jgi:hypothetical protein